MPAVKQPPRMTKGSKAREQAKRRLPGVLHEHNRKRNHALKLANRPGLPRWVQRQRRLEAKAAAKKAAEAQRKKLADFLGVKPEIVELKKPA